MTSQPPTEHRRRAADIALASVALDRLEVDQTTRDLLEAAVRGDMTAHELYDQVVERAQADQR
jgi:hypothetical protein